MSLGPVMLDLPGPELDAETQERLLHPLAGGVILFSRNYESPEQITALVAAVHALRDPHLLVSVDHEGGRVQRFRGGFSPLPAARRYGKCHATDPRKAMYLAQEGGWLMAAELRAVGVDFSFAPVLDLHRGVSRVIGDRAFHRDPEVVAGLARAFMKGMRTAGMEPVGKHFPGHGAVAADSHTAIPVDDRPPTDIFAEDMVAFERMVHYGLSAIMPAHVIYSGVDALPAGFSRRWLEDVLRGRLGFQGAVFSDDLSMAGAGVVGGPLERAKAALEAGCDMLLVCNDSDAAGQVLEGLEGWSNPVARMRLVRMHGRPGPTWSEMRGSERWRRAVSGVESLEPEPELELGDDAPA